MSRGCSTDGKIPCRKKLYILNQSEGYYSSVETVTQGKVLLGKMRAEEGNQTPIKSSTNKISRNKSNDFNIDFQTRAFDGF